jgi:hypothetical protein
LAISAANGLSGHDRLELPGLAEARQRGGRKHELAPRVSTKEMGEAILGEFEKLVG